MPGQPLPTVLRAVRNELRLRPVLRRVHLLPRRLPVVRRIGRGVLRLVALLRGVRLHRGLLPDLRRGGRGVLLRGHLLRGLHLQRRRLHPADLPLDRPHVLVGHALLRGPQLRLRALRQPVRVGGDVVHDERRLLLGPLLGHLPVGWVRGHRFFVLHHHRLLLGQLQLGPLSLTLARPATPFTPR